MNIKLAKQMLWIAGALEYGVAVMHFIMPCFIEEMEPLSQSFKDFVVLGITAIGLCQFVFGSLTIYFSSKLPIYFRIVRFYFLSQAFLWFARLIFEFIWPVKIRLFGLANPTIYILIICTIIVLLFLLPVLLIKKN